MEEQQRIEKEYKEAEKLRQQHQKMMQQQQQQEEKIEFEKLERIDARKRAFDHTRATEEAKATLDKKAKIAAEAATQAQMLAQQIVEAASAGSTEATLLDPQVGPPVTPTAPNGTSTPS